jgi:hypothetical protein
LKTSLYSVIKTRVKSPTGNNVTRYALHSAGATKQLTIIAFLSAYNESSNRTPVNAELTDRQSPALSTIPLTYLYWDTVAAQRVLYRCDTRSQVGGVRDRVLREIFGSKREEVTEG